MPTRVDIHPTARIAITAVLIAFLVVGTLLGIRRLFRGPSDTPANDTVAVHVSSSGATSTDALLPIIQLTIPDASLESGWSAALATALSGRTEFPVESGRVDVLTDHFAIEVDRLEKWHEAIGQAAHYALKTQKQPVAAIIIPSDLWPLNATTNTKLHLIDETCIKQGIKLILLRRN